MALSGLFQSSDFVSRYDFENFSQKIADKNINLRAVAWIPKVTRANRAAFEQKAKSEGFDDFEIKYLAAKGFKTSPQAAVYFPILYSEPLKTNRAALGLDLNSHPSVKMRFAKQWRMISSLLPQLCRLYNSKISSLE
ncbi:CHASE domain-containing protein [Psychrosphaera algicola]|uniref:CHASE domain-containing protein n=1 Tax=Psychrosphaera algicola TaxID=3023714 RepID=A0ABT5FHM5_9GAMM|nr:CHASE domain-containing protein [Psychrosphaera sp. G1-22]MDC2890687.1 CHASE domain-containing protein [Psychrosphaera sp. G1-22]